MSYANKIKELQQAHIMTNDPGLVTVGMAADKEVCKLRLELVGLRVKLNQAEEDNHMLTKVNCGIFDISDRLELVNADLERENQFLRDNAGNSNVS